jgi:HEAT repeat protein
MIHDREEPMQPARPTLNDTQLHILMADLQSPESERRSTAAATLGLSGDPRAVEPLAAALLAEHEMVRPVPWVLVDIVIALGNLGDARAVPALVSCFKLANQGGSEAREALIKIGEPALDPLIAILRSEPGDDVKAGVMLTIGQISGRVGDTRAVDLLIKQMHRADSFAIASAAQALGMIGDARATRHLLRTLRRRDSSELRRASAIALGRIGDRRATGPLSRAVADPDRQVRLAAVEALGWTGTRAAIKRIQRAIMQEESRLLAQLPRMDNPERAVRQFIEAAETAIARIETRFETQRQQAAHKAQQKQEKPARSRPQKKERSQPKKEAQPKREKEPRGKQPPETPQAGEAGE